MRLSILILLLVAMTDVMAEWEPAISNKTNTTLTYVDATTIHKIGGKAKMWSLTDLKAEGYLGEKKYLSQKDHREYDCKEGKLRLLAATLYSGNMGKGKVIDSNSITSDWSPVPPGTIEDALWKIACGLWKPQ